MGLFIGAAVVAFFSAVLLMIGIALEKSGKSFEDNKRRGRAEVVGYERADQSDWYTLLVRIPSLNDGKIYNCTAGKINISHYPKNSVIDVFYTPKQIAGIKLIEVHLLDKPPADSIKIGCGIKKVSYAMFFVAGVITVIGILTLIN